MIVKISCPTKFHSFNLAEQLAKSEMLNTFYTLYYSKKNKFFNLLNKRVDNEDIPISSVKTFPFYLPFFYYWKDEFKRAEVYDLIVANILKYNKDYKIFIGWSGMSFASAKQAKNDDKIVLIERGSTHILTQNEILNTEYKRFGINYSIDKRFIEKELKEYELADYIVIPSEFVYNSFIEKGISSNKLFKIPYGVSSYFKPNKNMIDDDGIFRILYLGSLTIQKGLPYLFEALEKISIDSKYYEVWFIGSINAELNDLIIKSKKSNWKFFGHIDHYELNNLISQCDIAVQPSLQEGLSMVIPQILACGIPLIATTNSGASEIIEDNKTGFIISIRDANAIHDKIMFLYSDKIKLKEMKTNCEKIDHNNFSWDTYGKRYTAFLKNFN